MKNYSKTKGENFFSTGLVDLFMWISAAETENQRKERTAYGHYWLRGQQRLGVLSFQQLNVAEKKLDEFERATEQGKAAFF